MVITDTMVRHKYFVHIGTIINWLNGRIKSTRSSGYIHDQNLKSVSIYFDEKSKVNS